VGGERVLPANTVLPAAVAARMWGGAYADGKVVRDLGGTPLRPGWVEYRAFDLTGAEGLTIEGEGQAEITVHTQGNEVLAQGAFKGGRLTLALKPSAGVRPVWICAAGKMELHSVCLNTR